MSQRNERVAGVAALVTEDSHGLLTLRKSVVLRCNRQTIRSEYGHWHQSEDAADRGQIGSPGGD